MDTYPLPEADLILRGAAEVLTCVPIDDNPMGRRAGASIAITGERILAVGSPEEIARQVDATHARVIDVTGKIVAPGFIDPHTHLVFGGSRVEEYAARMTRSAAEVRALGIPAGIQATVAMTRPATVDELTDSAAARLARMFRHGTTTVESKSGYALNAAGELAMLRVNRRLREIQPVDVFSTFLGAHDFPADQPRERYLDSLIHEMIPQAAEAGLAEFCDAYCDDGYYTVAETRRILEAGLAAGLRPKIHVDAYADIGGSTLAAELPVVSADHLNYTSREAMQSYARAGVVGVVMPGLDFAVRHPRPFDARAMFAEGMTLALATDLCPGCWLESMQLVMQLACRQYAFSPEEAVLAATVNAAQALGLADRGVLAPGKLADIQVWDLPSFEAVIYRLGNNAVTMVVKSGKVYPMSISD
jgi:imidazolonepropionase